MMNKLGETQYEPRLAAAQQEKREAFERLRSQSVQPAPQQDRPRPTLMQAIADSNELIRRALSVANTLDGYLMAASTPEPDYGPMPPSVLDVAEQNIQFTRELLNRLECILHGVV